MGMRADTEQQKRSPDALVGTERMLGCDGIRCGAYDLVESHHLALEKGSRKGYNYIIALRRDYEKPSMLS